MIRKAVIADLDSIEEAYNEHFAYEKVHGAYTVFQEGVYPTRADAEKALRNESLYVYLENGVVLGSIILNDQQPEEYKNIDWKSPAADEKVNVIHLLMVRPSAAGKGIGSALVNYAVNVAKQQSCTVLRLDTGKQNLPAVSLYLKSGFRLAASSSMKVGGIISHEGHLFFEKILDNDYSNISLETKDLILKKAVQKDWLDMYENLWRHAESAKYMLWNVTSSKEDAIARMERTIDFEKKEKYALLVYEKPAGHAIGFAGMRETEPGVYEETGVALGPDYTGKGYGKQILNALVDEAFNHCKADKFIACCRSTNIASRNLQLSCGFSFSHSEEKVDPRNGEKYVMEYYVKETSVN